MTRPVPAYASNALFELEGVRSLVHDILTGRNDLWAKTQLLDALNGVEFNLRKLAQ